MSDTKTHPVQVGKGLNKSRGAVRVEVSLAAYEVYAFVYGPQPALISGECRGGFGANELIAFLYTATGRTAIDVYLMQRVLPTLPAGYGRFSHSINTALLNSHMTTLDGVSKALGTTVRMEISLPDGKTMRVKALVTRIDFQSEPCFIDVTRMQDSVYSRYSAAAFMEISMSFRVENTTTY